MSTIDQAREILDLKTLKLPPKPKIERLQIEDFVDSLGEDALRIRLILSENTLDEDLTGEAVWTIKRAIHDALLAVGIRPFPFVSFAKQSELDQLREEVERRW